ncbi:hypothetical protein PQR75_44330 [Paraburkholderia fungorum]|uniref:hypothetical protein n=1 Tax=Paraburkholderia TaxID=1822464 RepID=UPI0038BB37B4
MLRDPRPVAGLRLQLERRLEIVDVQPRDPVQRRQRFRVIQAPQLAIAHQPPHDRTVLLLDPGLVVLLVGTRAGQFDTRVLAEVEHGFVHEGGVVIAVEAAQGKWQCATDALDVLNDERMVAERHRQTFGPASRDVGHHQAVHKVTIDLGAAAMLDEVDLQIAGQRIVPVGKGPDRDRAADRIPHASGTPALPSEGLFTNIPEQPVDRGRADAGEPLTQGVGQRQITIPGHRLDQRRNHRLQPLAADPVRGLPQRDQRCKNLIVVAPLWTRLRFRRRTSRHSTRIACLR